MSGQLSIAYKPSYTGSESWQRQLSVLRTVVEHLGRKEVAYELDVSGSQLSDSLNERDRKRWAAEWTHVVLAMLDAKHDPASRSLLRQVAETGLAATSLVVDEPIEMTPEEEVLALKRELLALEGGKAAIDRLRKRGRR